MEADWAVEIGPDLPVIDALWPGFIDLKTAPNRIAEIFETASLPALARTLLAIHPSNATEKQARFWTAKCDLWQPDEWDPYEMQAGSHAAQSALACYIDLLPAGTENRHTLFRHWQNAEQCAKELASRMGQFELACVRADCIVRAALLHDREGFGITIYLTACGETPENASASLSAGLHHLSQALAAMPPHPTENLLPVQ